MTKQVQVRIAVVVDRDGGWAAVAYHDRSTIRNFMLAEAGHALGALLAKYIVTATLDTPSDPNISEVSGDAEKV